MAGRVQGQSATAHALTVAQIKERIEQADEGAFEALKRAYEADSRAGVQTALKKAQAHFEAQHKEAQRLHGMYSYQNELALDFCGANGANGADCAHVPVIVGLDEVGRGPLAGPLAVGAVVLPCDEYIEGLNDSKQIAPHKREKIAQEIKSRALAWSIQYIEADKIDACGMTACLIIAFRRAIAAIEEQGIVPDIVLLDGNPLHLDTREVNVVKGDARCASIAAASIIAKVDRDELMVRYAAQYPAYHLDACKGYASPAHIEAIKQYGLTPIHRASFCTAFTQESLFSL